MIPSAAEVLNEESSEWACIVQLKHLVSSLYISESDLSIDNLWLDSSIFHSVVFLLQRCDFGVEFPDLLLIIMRFHWVESNLLSKYDNLFDDISDAHQIVHRMMLGQSIIDR